jgi:hypothetical protein
LSLIRWVPGCLLPDPPRLCHVLQAGNRFSRFPELCERIRAELPRPEVILDGEVVAIDEGGAGGLLEPDERSGALGRFRREMRTSRTIEFEADHHLFNSHPDRTSRELRAFLLAS